jgi:hypothetical protein
MGHPHWGEVPSAVVHPKLQTDTAYIALGIGLVGTTIAPWMQFYMQSAVIEKGLKIEDYKYTLADVAVGCILTIVVAFFIMVACGSTLHVHGVVINDAGDAAMALQAHGGPTRGLHLRGGALRRGHLLRDHPAGGHRLLRLRGLRIRGGHRQDPGPGAPVLRAVHGHPGGGRGHHPDPERAPHQNLRLVADHQRDPASRWSWCA